MLIAADPVSLSPNPEWIFQYGAAGALLFCMVGGFFALRWLLDRHDRQLDNRDNINANALKLVTDANEKNLRELSAEVVMLANTVKEGLLTINTALEKREDQNRYLFDKQLEVIIKVTENLGILAAKVADNTKEIAELKTIVKEIQQKIRD